MAAARKAVTLGIAGLNFRIDSPFEIAWLEDFKPFLLPEDLPSGEAGGFPPDFTVTIRPVGSLPVLQETVLHCGVCYDAAKTESGKPAWRFYDGIEDEETYAVARFDWDAGTEEITYLPGAERYFADSRNTFYHIPWERVMVRGGRLVVHASCIDSPYGGILFCGPSGIGKSTQARLWCNKKGARQINGDRPVLWRRDGSWEGWGSPYAGSSKIHVNEGCPISAAVVLKKASGCSIKRLAPAESFRAIFSGTAVYRWDEKFVEKAADLVMNFISEVPVYELSCTPDERAVEALEEELKKGGSL